MEDDFWLHQLKGHCIALYYYIIHIEYNLIIKNTV